MPGSSAPKDPAIEELDDDHSSSKGRRQPSSVLGLSIVSGLNIACLAFIAYHFSTHPQEPEAALTELPAASETADAPRPMPAAPAVFGNVDLVPAPRNVIDIASGFSLTGEGWIDRPEGGSTVFAEPGGLGEAEAADAAGHSGHWVQLGALSKETTARRYWSGLKLQHKSLLQDREPRFFGPAEVGGGLYHIRLGPMDDEAAARLCEKLETAGVDCFCVRPREEQL